MRRADGHPARTLAELGRERLAVEKMSIPVFTLRQRGHEVYVVNDAEAVIAALAGNRTAYGYLWGPIAGWLLRDRRDVLIVEEFVPVDLWDFGIAVRAGDEELQADLNDAVARALEDGVTARLFAAHNVPWTAPRHR